MSATEKRSGLPPVEALVAELREANEKRTWGIWLNASWSGQSHLDHAHSRNVCEYKYTLSDEPRYLSTENQVELVGRDDYGVILSKENAAFIALAANSMDKLLRIIEVQREALEDCTNGDLASSEGIYKSEIARLALAKSDRIAEGRE